MPKKKTLKKLSEAKNKARKEGGISNEMNVNELAENFANIKTTDGKGKLKNS